MRPCFPYMRADEPTPPRWNRLSDYFRHRYGRRVQKIPLDAGFSCPNRDGTLSSGGCVFCNPLGSGTGLGLGGLDIAGQWQKRCEKPRARGTNLFLAYLQSFSNTYGPIERLASVLEVLAPLPDMVGVSVGTRPDCVDDDKLALISDVCAMQNWSERWIEFGVQSSNNATLERIRRGHDRGCAEKAIAGAARAGLSVCIHLIAGLPGESAADFMQSVRWASSQSIHGIKLHCLYVCKGSSLAADFCNGGYTPWTEEQYVAAVADALPFLRPDIVVQRLTGDPSPGELLAPDWCAQSRNTLNRLSAELVRRDTWQGCAYHTPVGGCAVL